MKNIRDKILAFMRDGSYAPMTSEELLDALAGECSATKFWQELLALEQNGEIIKTRFETYGLPEKMGLVDGRFQLTSKGFGFVIPDNKGERPDVFIPPRALNGARNNDRVLARVNNDTHGKKPEGEILRIITHANNKVVGIFHQTGDFAFVTPDDKRIGQDVYVMRRDFNNAKDGQKVVVEITEWPQEHRKAEGKVTEILGNIGDVGLEILSIIKQNDLPLEFPEEVLAASRKVPKAIKKTELAGRRDLRERTVVTVDGEDAKDLDDAVYVQQISADEYLLGVYIADVSYYVTEDSILDKEARERGTSVYLVDRVLPMLPERLSNGICSLNAGEDRLSMACEMHIDSKGTVLNYEIFPAVINVRHRLSYNIVRSILAGDEELCTKYADILPMVGKMDELRQILHDKRARRGAVDFDLPEQKVILDEKLHPVEIVQRVHGNAESIIEEFMLAANETVAQQSALALYLSCTRNSCGGKNAGFGQAAGKFQYKVQGERGNSAQGNPAGRARGSGPARGTLDYYGSIALHEAGSISDGERGSLWPVGQILYPLHFAHSPLPRPYCASFAASMAAGTEAQGGRGGALERQAGNHCGPFLHSRARCRGCGARHCGAEEMRIHGGSHWRGI